jgi:CRP-like cAMP-binding protein
VPAYHDGCLTPKISALSEIALFAALSESELQGLGQRAVEKRFAPDEMLFWEGEECAGIFLIIQGTVKIFRTSPGGREVMLSIEAAPATVAELPLYSPEGRTRRRSGSWSRSSPCSPTRATSSRSAVSTPK